MYALVLLAVLLQPSTRPSDEPAEAFPPTTPNVGHERHLHPHNPKHPAAPDAERFTTNRPNAKAMDLAAEEDAFTFVVFGDRTGGPDEGVAVLADAVRDVNLLEPDFVMTVGDLIQGYNEQDEWLEQMREYRGIMDQLICPWFPVAGNHDIYWRDRDRSGDQRPEGEHEDVYELHFGPLWYAFEHKNNWFIVLYTDEGNPDTGEKSIREPESQRMSDEQLDWLKQTIAKAADAPNVFLFMHHPRWIGGRYGDDWDKVHDALVDAGNVRAVFAGHIHRMRYDPKDGIDYVTLATTGGVNGMAVPEAGMLHHFNVVTVRDNQVAYAAVPVGDVLDVREITSELATDAESLATLQADVDAPIELASDGSAKQTITVTIQNPVERTIDIALTPESRDSRWVFLPDHRHATLKAGESKDFEFRVRRVGDSLDESFRAPMLAIDTQMLAPATRYTIPTVEADMNYQLPRGFSPEPIADDGVLVLDGDSDGLRIDNDDIALHDGPMTLEAWFTPAEIDRRMALVSKTEGSEFGLYVSDGVPRFPIHLDGEYVEPSAESVVLEAGRRHHLAGVFDGSEVRLYLDGQLLATIAAEGSRTTNPLPMYIGGDTNRRGDVHRSFAGTIDAVRLSDTARYSGAVFTPDDELADDEDTVLLFQMDRTLGEQVWGTGRDGAVLGRLSGDAVITAE
ncbi:MAG: LamG-like jellyroll fold domain-containing protein [Planctomycetota bacterium]